MKGSFMFAFLKKKVKVGKHSTLDNVMIDLETIGNDYNGIFTNIGAVIFNPKTGEIGKTFYRRIT